MIFNINKYVFCKIISDNLMGDVLKVWNIEKQQKLVHCDIKTTVLYHANAWHLYRNEIYALNMYTLFVAIKIHLLFHQ